MLNEARSYLKLVGGIEMTDSEKLDMILEKVIEIDKRLKKVEITLENETNKNI